MNLVFIGPPGSGKGSVAKELVKLRPELRHISTGDLLRAKNLTAGDGSLNPDDTVKALVQEEFSRDDGAFILDGFPRNLAQAEWLVKHTQAGVVIDAVVHFLCSDEVAAIRVLGRRHCPECGDTSKRYPETRCWQCNKALVTRADDTLETVVRRLGIYHRETEPCISSLREKGIGVLTLYCDTGLSPDWLADSLVDAFERLRP